MGLLFLQLLERLGPQLLYTSFAVFCVIAVVFVKKKVIETAGSHFKKLRFLFFLQSRGEVAQVFLPSYYNMLRLFDMICWGWSHSHHRWNSCCRNQFVQASPPSGVMLADVKSTTRFCVPLFCIPSMDGVMRMLLIYC